MIITKTNILKYSSIIKIQKQKIKNMWKNNKKIDSNTNSLLRNEIIKYIKIKNNFNQLMIKNIN